MAIYISLIRGINVGGRNMIAMEKLRALHTALGFGDVKTHLQSGNVLFTAKAAEPLEIAKRIEDALRKDGLDVRVVVRTPAELREAIERNPFPAHAKKDPSHYVVVFLDREPAAADAAELAQTNVGPEEKKLVGRDLYVFYPDMARSKLTNTLIERKLGVTGTARNWNTVNKLVELAAALER